MHFHASVFLLRCRHFYQLLSCGCCLQAPRGEDLRQRALRMPRGHLRPGHQGEGGPGVRERFSNRHVWVPQLQTFKKQRCVSCFCLHHLMLCYLMTRTRGKNESERKRRIHLWCFWYCSLVCYRSGLINACSPPSLMALKTWFMFILTCQCDAGSCQLLTHTC